jgi:hypothetical protein
VNSSLRLTIEMHCLGQQNWLIHECDNERKSVRMSWAGIPHEVQRNRPEVLHGLSEGERDITAHSSE